MGERRGWAWVAALACATGLLAPGTSAAAAPRGAPCAVVAFSPRFRTDGVGLCLHQAISEGKPPGPVEVWLTTNSGRSWSRTKADGLSWTSDEKWQYYAPRQVIFSPRYAEDKTIFVLVLGGLYATADLGATFSLADGLAGTTYGDRDDAFAPLPVAPTGSEADVTRRATMLYAPSGAIYTLGDPQSQIPPPAIVSPPAHVPVRGAVTGTLAFLVPPNYPAQPVLALGVQMTFDTRLHRIDTLAQCDVALRCETVLHSFGDAQVSRAWLAPDYATSGVIYAVVGRYGGWRAADGVVGPRVVVSRDRGRTFSTWAPADALLAPMRKAENVAVAARLVFDDDNRDVMWLRASLAHHGRYDGPPAEQVFRTTDGGRRWTRVAFASRPGSRGPAGTLPFDSPPVGDSAFGSQAVLVDAGGRLFATGARTRGTRYSGVWCSLDGGRTWAPTCPR